MPKVQSKKPAFSWHGVFIPVDKFDHEPMLRPHVRPVAGSKDRKEHQDGRGVDDANDRGNNIGEEDRQHEIDNTDNNAAKHNTKMKRNRARTAKSRTRHEILHDDDKDASKWARRTEELALDKSVLETQLKKYLKLVRKVFHYCQLSLLFSRFYWYTVPWF